MASLMRDPLPDRESTCEKHGAFASHNFFGDRWTACAKCAEEEAQQRREVEEKAKRENRRRWAMRRSGLDGRFLDVTFDSFEPCSSAQQKVLQACREYASNVARDAGTGLWLIGPPGTGKTHLGSAIVRHLIDERSIGAAIFSGREIIRMLRSTWGKRSEASDWTGGDDAWPNTEEGLIEDLGTISLLVIDEIGASFGSDAEQVQLFEIIDLRYKHRRPTVLLSNLPAKGLKDAIGDRSYDRLREGATVLPCNWDSYRGKPAASKHPLQVVPK